MRIGAHSRSSSPAARGTPRFTSIQRSGSPSRMRATCSARRSPNPRLPITTGRPRYLRPTRRAWRTPWSSPSSSSSPRRS
eukprot:3269270-Pyramimonas_sp.AAC.1